MSNSPSLSHPGSVPNASPTISPVERTEALRVDHIPRRVDLTVTSERTFGRAAQSLALALNRQRALFAHDRIIERTLTLTLDDGSERTFVAFRVQHSDVLGPYKGGIRFHPELNQETLSELAMLMTWKTSLAGLPFGGAKGGIRVDPSELSRDELQRLTHAFVDAFRDVIGPDRDIMAPDINTDEHVMGWIVDAWADHSEIDPAIVTGKPVERGGIRLRGRSTALGVLVMTQRSLAEDGQSLAGTTVAIQGFGNVGRKVAQLFSATGAKVVAVSDVTGGVQSPQGLDVAALSEHARRTGGVRDFTSSTITNEELLSMKVDVLIPAAVGGVITAGNADQIRARLVVEGANGPVSAMANAILQHRGVRVVPDILANCGGVVGSYLEWQQNRSGAIWRDDEILQMFLERLHDTYSRVQQTMSEHGVPMRLACYLNAIRGVLDGMEERDAKPQAVWPVNATA